MIGKPTTTTRPMRFARACALAVEALQRQRRAVTFERNLYARGLVSPITERGAKRYQELTDAIETLQELGRKPE